jgi:hypothetical protein
MPRIRTIRPTVWTDPRFVELSRSARLTLVGIVSKVLDDHGRGSANPRVLRGEIYPCDDTVTVAEVGRELEDIFASGILRAYSANSQQYLHLPEWSDDSSPWCQKIDKPSKSILPPPPGSVPHETSRTLDERSTKARRAVPTDGKGKEESGGDERGERESPGGTHAPPPGEMRHESDSPNVRGAIDDSEQSAREAEEDAHRRRRAQAATFAKEHPEVLEQVEAAVDRQLEGRSGWRNIEETRKALILGELLKRMKAHDSAGAEARGTAVAANAC